MTVRKPYAIAVAVSIDTKEAPGITPNFRAVGQAPGEMPSETGGLLSCRAFNEGTGGLSGRTLLFRRVAVTEASWLRRAPVEIEPMEYRVYSIKEQVWISAFCDQNSPLSFA